MKYYAIDVENLENPSYKECDDFPSKNGFICPGGDFYGCYGGQHHRAAAYIAIFILGLDETALNHGTYFRDGWCSVLMRRSWAMLINATWLTGVDHKAMNIEFRDKLNKMQMDCVLEYSKKYRLKIQNLHDFR